jgi:hypothetical protein
MWYLRRRIQRIRTKNLDDWSPADADLLTAVDAVIRDYTLTEEQWTQLSTRYGTSGVIEIVMLAAILNSAGTRVEPDVTVSVPLS